MTKPTQAPPENNLATNMRPRNDLADRLRQAAIDACAFQKLDGDELDNLLHEAADAIEAKDALIASRVGEQHAREIYQAHFDDGWSQGAAATIERCAQVAESFWPVKEHAEIADEIRKLKDETP